MSGSFEHTPKLAFLLRHAKKRENSMVVALFGLKPLAMLIIDSLQIHLSIIMYHNVNIYDGFTTSVGTKNYITPAMKFEKDILQGGFLSPLIINVIFNTLIQSMERIDELKQMGYVYHEILNEEMVSSY